MGGERVNEMTHALAEHLGRPDVIATVTCFRILEKEPNRVKRMVKERVVRQRQLRAVRFQSRLRVVQNGHLVLIVQRFDRDGEQIDV